MEDRVFAVLTLVIAVYSVTWNEDIFVLSDWLGFEIIFRSMGVESLLFSNLMLIVLWRVDFDLPALIWL